MDGFSLLALLASIFSGSLMDMHGKLLLFWVSHWHLSLSCFLFPWIDKVYIITWSWWKRHCIRESFVLV